MLPGAPNANVTDALAANVPVELSDASPQPEDVPFRDIVPVKDEPVLLVTVRNPESGLAQIVLLVLHTALETVPVPDSVPVLLLPDGLLTVNVPDPTEIFVNVPSFPEAAIPETTMVSPVAISAPSVRV